MLRISAAQTGRSAAFFQTLHPASHAISHGSKTMRKFYFASQHPHLLFDNLPANVIHLNEIKEKTLEEKKIVARKLQGFWELPPEKQVIFEGMLDKIKEVFKRHCFLPLDTPAMELSEILLAKSGGDIDKEIYRFVKGSTDACLRYDLTVPLARFVAMNENTLSFPFKRYQIGKVYRGERPQKGRLREFYQCDADIIGDGELSLVNDAECVKLYKDIFQNLNLPVQTEISSRKVLFGLIEDLGQAQQFSNISICLDKFDKIGEDGVRQGLEELGLNDEQIQKLISFVKLNGGAEIFEKAEALCSNPTFLQGVAELKEIDGYLRAYGLDGNDYKFNFSIIRGHNYYTGTVFEAYLAWNRGAGAIGGGGRYEDLAGYFTSKKLPGVGMSIGMSRLFDIIQQNTCEKVEFCKCAVIPMGDTLEKCLNFVDYLQQNGVCAEIYGENKSFKSKLKEANKRGVNYVAIIGEDEVKQDKITLKDMSASSQQILTKQQILNILR